jgi:hypothetical protein
VVGKNACVPEVSAFGPYLARCTSWRSTCNRGAQVGLVMEDRGRIERLMGIAQHLQLPSALAATPSNASTASTMSSRTPSHCIGSDAAFKAPSHNSGMLGSSIFRALGMGSQASAAEPATCATSQRHAWLLAFVVSSVLMSEISGSVTKHNFLSVGLFAP